VTRHGGHIERIYVCPHAPGLGCRCRKPAPGLLLRAARELGVDLEQSVLVGDSLTDVQAAQAAGCRSIVVGEPPVVGIDLHVPSVADLGEAVALIASDRRGVPARC
jgi:histidinol phosphatase-like enzyme